ncbi:hypothetical protein KR009_005399 [Drosophila setifemur]|nr:hypothetical protein KR009_005399 [Drosophila setifemur]
MFLDNFDIEPFNPFMVGPPNSGARPEIKIPTCVTYPPPVFVAKPEYVKAAEEQAALRAGPKESPSRGSQPKLDQTKVGGVSISKAINEEMTMAKQQAAAIHKLNRIGAGAVSKATLAEDSKSKKSVASDSVHTLMAVRSRRPRSGEVQARSSESESSVASDATSSSTLSSKASKASKASRAKKTLSTATITPKSILKPLVPPKMSLTRAKADSRSQVSEKSSEASTQSSAKANSSKRSMSSQKSKTQSTKDIKSSKAKEDASNALKSKTNVSAATLKSQTSLRKNVTPMKSQSELSGGKSLTQQAADLADRLNAGIDPSFRRYDSVVRDHSIRVPRKLADGDRMSFWFSDAVLS